jgi:hypothetical protein
MSGPHGPKQQFERDVRMIRSMFGFFYCSIQEKERRENFRLYRRLKHAIHQLNLCRELARTLDTY